MNIKSNKIHFHHTGIVTENILGSRDLFVDLGYEPSKYFKDEAQGLYVIVLNKKFTHN